MSAKKPGRLVRLAEAAPYANVSVGTLRRRIADGTITGYRCGPKLLQLDLDEIDSKLIRRVASRKAAAA